MTYPKPNFGNLVARMYAIRNIYLHRVGDILYIIKTVGSRTWVVGTHFLDLKLGLLIRRLLQISAINVASTFRKKLLSNLGFIEHLSYARAWIDVN